jgi:hypothetical protein
LSRADAFSLDVKAFKRIEAKLDDCFLKLCLCQTLMSDLDAISGWRWDYLLEKIFDQSLH